MCSRLRQNSRRSCSSGLATWALQVVQLVVQQLVVQQAVVQQVAQQLVMQVTTLI